MPLNPTPKESMLDAKQRPYFLWDLDMTIDKFTALLRSEDDEIRGSAQAILANKFNALLSRIELRDLVDVKAILETCDVDFKLALERAALKDHPNASLFRRNVRPVVDHRLGINHNFACSWRFKPGDQPQQSRFAAATFANQTQQFAFLNLERDIAQSKRSSI